MVRSSSSRRRARPAPSTRPAIRPSARVRTGRGATGESGRLGESTTVARSGDGERTSGRSRFVANVTNCRDTALLIRWARAGSVSTTVISSRMVSGSTRAETGAQIGGRHGQPKLLHHRRGDRLSAYEVGVGTRTLLRQQAALVGAGRGVVRRRDTDEHGRGGLIRRRRPQHHDRRDGHRDHHAQQQQLPLCADQSEILPQLHRRNLPELSSSVSGGEAGARWDRPRARSMRLLSRDLWSETARPPEVSRTPDARAARGGGLAGAAGV